MNRLVIVIISMLVIGIIPMVSKEANPENDPSILDDIISDSIHTILQDESLAALLDFNPIKKVEKKQGNIGYRVQVFSDNNVRTARNEARVKQRAIRARFPQYDSYVTYTTPYWRLRVGDFKTHEEAQAACAALQRAFPAYARELRVVRDRIRVSN